MRGRKYNHFPLISYSFHNIHFYKECSTSSKNLWTCCDVVSVAGAPAKLAKRKLCRSMHFVFRDTAAIIEWHSRGSFVVRKWRLRYHQVVHRTFPVRGAVANLRPASFRSGWSGAWSGINSVEPPWMIRSLLCVCVCAWTSGRSFSRRSTRDWFLLYPWKLFRLNSKRGEWTHI